MSDELVVFLGRYCTQSGGSSDVSANAVDLVGDELQQAAEAVYQLSNVDGLMAFLKSHGMPVRYWTQTMDFFGDRCQIAIVCRFTKGHIKRKILEQTGWAGATATAAAHRYANRYSEGGDEVFDVNKERRRKEHDYAGPSIEEVLDNDRQRR